MNSLMIKNLYTALLDALPDPAVGISLAHLAGDKLFSVYGTEISPRSRLTAHFHRQGEEFYQVIEGKGVMLLGDAEPNDSYSKGTTAEISKGDIFIIPALTVHQLINPGPDPLIMLFSCPQSHISTDRYLVGDLTSENREG